MSTNLSSICDSTPPIHNAAKVRNIYIDRLRLLAADELKKETRET